MVLVGLEHLRVVVRVELDGKHIGDAGIPQALMPQGVAVVQRKHADKNLGRTTMKVCAEVFRAWSRIANSSILLASRSHNGGTIPYLALRPN